jgi:DNA-binding transcriptional LysR family regulator
MWRDVELRELRVFLALADELHFGRTAERLGISQPAVSESVRALESRLGVKVFDRTSRRVRLRPAGEGLERGLVPALAAIDRALAGTSELSRTVQGLLTLVPVSDLPPLPLGLVWCASRDNPRIRALNEIAAEMAAE